MLNLEERRLALALSRRSVEAYVLRKPIEVPGDFVSKLPASLREEAAVFVTLHSRGNPEQLRGCVGFLTPGEPLWKSVQEAAVAAASRDPRFPPVAPDELPQLRLEISVLSPAVPITLREIQIGVHGLIVSQGRARGLLLPQVREEHGWTAEQFLEQTCRKAGLAPQAWRQGATVEAFTAEIFSED